MRATYRCAAVGLLLAVSLLFFTESADAAKKKKSKKKSAPKAAAATADATRCGVCVVAVDEIFKELATTENSTSTLDLRWGLTAEVKEGRAKRIGKVIKYNRSQLRSIEVMEKICGEMKKYQRYTEVKDEFQLKTKDQIKAIMGDQKPKNSEEEKEDRKRDENRFERFCEELTESSENQITTAIKEDLTYEQFIDAVCFGAAEHPCGVSRPKCAPGSFSEHSGAEGLSPCSLCAFGFFQSQEGELSCSTCPNGFNTTAPGSASEDLCVKMCEAGSFSPNGLESPSECSKCGQGAYQPKRGMQSCDSCPDGKNTHSQGAVYLNECVSICGDGRRSSDEGCDDSNKYPGDGCDHDCNIEAGSRCSINNVGSSSVCNKVVCGDGKVQNAEDQSVKETCDDGNTEEGDGCSPVCVIETGWKCAEKDGKSVCKEVKCGDGLQEKSADMTRVEKCDDGNEVDGDGCSSACDMEVSFICSTRKDSKSTCSKPVCGDSYRESVDGMNEECDDGNKHDDDGCSSLCTVEEAWACESVAGSPKRKDANGVGEWTSEGKDKCLWGPDKLEKKPEDEKKEGGFWNNMFGGKKKDEI